MNLFGRFLFATLFVTLITEALADAAPDPEALDKLTLNVNIKDEDEKGNNDNDVYYDTKKNEYADYEASKDEYEDGDIEYDDYDTAIVPIFIKNKIGEPIKPDGHWGQWGRWGPCSVTCGRGKKKQHRKCIGGRPGSRGCKGSPTRRRTCRGPPCVYPQWCPWTPGRCSVTCGYGTEQRERICSRRCYYPHGNREKRQIGSETDSKSEDGEESGPGYFPPPHQCREGQRDYDYIPCNPGPCPEPEHWCDFGPWSPCSVTCDRGTRTRQRECRRHCYYTDGEREKRQIGTGTDTKSKNGDEHGNWPQCREGDVDYDHEDCWEKPCWTTPRPTWTTTWETPTKPTWTTPRPTWTTTWTTRPGPPRCICINPWEGTADSHFGDPDERCRTMGECYVECDYGCRDQAASKEGAGVRCVSKVACDKSILAMAKETGQKDEN